MMKKMSFVYNIVIVLIYIKLTGTSSEGGHPTIGNGMTELIDSGKHQYDILNERIKIPRYGLCWKRAVSYLHGGCRSLTDEVQSNIALSFTDCFLQMSGYESYKCEETKGLLRKECMQGMSDRAFHAYTEFYTHTQNMCFFLQSHIWHEETEKIIDRLSSSSAKVTKQLEEAESMQNIIFEHQKKSMLVQMELLENGISLREVLHESHNSLTDIMQEFRTSTLEQRRLLFDVFDRVASFQEWAIGEISWLDTAVFYLFSTIISYIITATPRTQEARYFIFLSLSVNAVIERVICLNFVSDSTDEIGNLNESLSWWIWLCRKILIGICVLILGVSVYSFCNYNLINYNLLIEIQQQNLKLCNYMEKYKMASDIVEEQFETTSCNNLHSNDSALSNTNCSYVLPSESVLYQGSSFNSDALQKTERDISLRLKKRELTSTPRSPLLSTISTRSSNRHSSGCVAVNIGKPNSQYNLRNSVSSRRSAM